jgi:alpha-tubulin suppressor-like RCC1 family protein
MRSPYLDTVCLVVASLVTGCDRHGTEARSGLPTKASDNAASARSSHADVGGSARSMDMPLQGAVILSADYGVQCAARGRVVHQWGFPFASARRQAPTDIVLPDAIVDVSCSTWHSCALTVRGEVQCWGLNSQGQLGVGGGASSCVGEPRPCSAQPLPVAGLSDIVSIATFQDQTCGVTRHGGVYCWGANTLQWRGDALGETVSRVPGLANMRKVAIGLLFACALDQQGGVWCWGKNDQGQLGRGTAGPLVDGPAAVVGMKDVVAIAAGPAQACALTRSSIYCWGSNDNGDLGVPPDRCGHEQCTPTPTKVPLPKIVQPVRLASSSSTCLTSSDGATYCWGRGLYGSVGQPTERCGGDPCAKTPRKIEAVPPLVDLSSAQDHVCGRTASNELVCWGTLGGFDFSGAKRDGDAIDTGQRRCAGCVGPLFRFQLQAP